MKLISLLLLSIFILSSCEQRKQPSSSLDDTILSPDNTNVSATLDELMKYNLAVVIEEGLPKCWISLEGKASLAPSFAEVYPSGEPVYSKRIVSFEEAENMTEEEIKEVFVMPFDTNLHPCDVKDESSVAQLAPELTLVDGTTEEIAGMGGILIQSGIGCTAGYFASGFFPKLDDETMEDIGLLLPGIFLIGGIFMFPLILDAGRKMVINQSLGFPSRALPINALLASGLACGFWQSEIDNGIVFLNNIWVEE